MTGLEEFINEMLGDPVDAQWLNDKKPVMTRDGRSAVVVSVDYSVVPNVIHGQVVQKEQSFPYTWNEDGTCITAKDIYGNPKQPDKNDDLVKNG